MKKVTLYAMAQCAQCDSAKQYFAAQNIKYRLVNVKSPAGQKEFAKTGFRAVPIIKVSDSYLNGFSIAKFKTLYQA